MTEEVGKYFMQQYNKAKFRVVPGHWPDFESKEEVDAWIEAIGSITLVLADNSTTRKYCPRCKNEEIRLTDNYCKICGLKLED